MSAIKSTFQIAPNYCSATPLCRLLLLLHTHTPAVSAGGVSGAKVRVLINMPAILSNRFDTGHALDKLFKGKFKKFVWDSY